MRQFSLLFFILLFWLPSAHALEFTGHVDVDFPLESCVDDPNGQNIAFPGTFPAGTISGFDVRQICFLYNRPEDKLYVGVATFDSIIFGDADGDGDPGSAGSALTQQGGIDWPDLSTGEYFALILDFDSDPATTPNAVAGVSAERTAPGGFRVSEIASPDPGLSFSFLSSYYGSLLSSGTVSTMHASPTLEAPHLEFTIGRMTAIPGFSDLNLDDPATTITVYFRAGSLSDTVIGDEAFEVQAFTINDYVDSDGDDLTDPADTDADNDGAPDSLEGSADTDGDGLADDVDTDSDGDGILDVDENGLTSYDTNGDRSIFPNELSQFVFTVLPDADGDGIPNFQDTDSDGDGILDSVEAGDLLLVTPPVDSEGDGIPDYLDTDSDNDGLSDADEIALNTNPTNSDSDGDGISDGAEHIAGTDPSDPLDPLGTPVGAVGTATGGSWLQGGGAGCSLSDRPVNFSPSFLIFLLPFALRFFRRLTPLLFLLLMSFPVFALNVEQFRPQFDGLGLINLLTSDSLGKKGYSASIGFGFANNPLEQVAAGVTSSLVSYQFSGTLYGAYGFTDRLEAGLSFPFFPVVRSGSVGSAATSTSAAMGDISLQGKFSIWEGAGGTARQGLAVSPFFTLPSGSVSKFTGDESVTGGVKGIYDINWDTAKLASNLGVRFREKENISGLAVGPELLFGVGFSKDILRRQKVALLTELDGSTTFNGFLAHANRTPLEWLYSFRKTFSRGFGLDVGGGAGLTKGYGTPDFRFFSVLHYSPSFKQEEPPSFSENSKMLRVEEGQIVILKPIHFATGRAEILPDSFPVLEAVADLLKDNMTIRRVAVNGHTDNRGTVAYNLRLSQARAQAVVGKLVEYGVAPSRLESHGWGEAQPVAEGTDDTSLSQNRRVEFQILEVQRPPNRLDRPDQTRL